MFTLLVVDLDLSSSATDMPPAAAEKPSKLTLKSETVRNLSIEFTDDEVTYSSWLKMMRGDMMHTERRDHYIRALLDDRAERASNRAAV